MGPADAGSLTQRPGCSAAYPQRSTAPQERPGSLPVAGGIGIEAGGRAAESPEVPEGVGPHWHRGQRRPLQHAHTGSSGEPAVAGGEVGPSWVKTRGRAARAPGSAHEAPECQGGQGFFVAAGWECGGGSGGVLVLVAGTAGVSWAGRGSQLDRSCWSSVRAGLFWRWSMACDGDPRGDSWDGAGDGDHQSQPISGPMVLPGFRSCGGHLLGVDDTDEEREVRQRSGDGAESDHPLGAHRVRPKFKQREGHKAAMIPRMRGDGSVRALTNVVAADSPPRRSMDRCFPLPRWPPPAPQ